MERAVKRDDKIQRIAEKEIEIIELKEKLSKKELLEYRILRRKNRFNKRECRFVKVNNLLTEKSFIVGKINNEYD